MDYIDIKNNGNNTYHNQQIDHFTFRIINPVEVANLTDEALHYLMFLRDSYSVTEICFESILADISSTLEIIDVFKLKDLLKCKGIFEKKVVN
jgi:hypothetical protein